MPNTNRIRTILFVHHSNDLYGADIVLLQTLRGLDRSRYAPFVVLPDDCAGSGGLAGELEKLGVPYNFTPLAILRRKYLHPARLPLYFFRFLLAVGVLIRIIRRKQVNLVHSNTLAVCSGAVAARLTRTPHVWHVHEMLVRPAPVRRALHFLAPRMSSTVVCISEAVRQHVLKDEPAAGGKLAVVHNGLPLENFVPVSDGSSIRREFGIAAGAPLVGMVGRINHWKGQLVLVCAAKSVLASFPDANFLVVGSVFADEVRHLDRLREEVLQAGIEDRFILSDFRRDVPEILAALDVYVHPALLPEPFGLVVIEAMAAAKPVVATAHGGPLEMIEDGVSGYLVPPADPGALAEKISACLADLESSREMGRRAQERVMRMFPLSRYLDGIANVYEQVLGTA